MKDIQLCIGQRNGDGKRSIVYRLGDDEYPDVLDTQSGWQREQSLKRAMNALGIDPDGCGLSEAFESNLSVLDAEVAKLVKEEDEKAEGGKLIDFAPMTCSQLMQADVSVEYLIDNLIVARQPILLAGPVKTLKTSLLMALVFALATGVHFLGYFRVLRSIAVGVLTGESGLATIKDTLLRIGRAAGIDPSSVNNLIISDRIPQLSNLLHLDAIRKLILDYELEMLAVDPAYLALDGADAGNVMIFGQQLRAVSQLCQEMGVSLLLCHHTKKASGIDGQPLSLTDAAWAGFAEHCRQWLLVNNRERYDHETGTSRLWLSGGGSAGHGGEWAVDVVQGRIGDVGGRRWDVSVDTPREARSDVEARKDVEKAAKVDAAIEKDCERINKAVAKYPTGETAKILREVSGVNSSRFGVALARLLERCELKPCEIVKPCRKTPFDGYKLAD